MVNVCLQELAKLGPAATWFVSLCAAVVAVFVLYVGIVLRAVLRASDQEQRQLLYEIFRDLLGCSTLKWPHRSTLIWPHLGVGATGWYHSDLAPPGSSWTATRRGGSGPGGASG